MTMPSVEDLYRSMYRIRRFEETAYDLFTQRILIGPIHTYIGQEAIGVGISASLRTSDFVVSNHRGHGHLIAKGGDLGRMLGGADTETHAYRHLSFLFDSGNKAFDGSG